MTDNFLKQMQQATQAWHRAAQAIAADINAASEPHHATQEQRHNGTVLWFDRKKGHGFITADDPEICDGGLDVFVHYSGIEGEGHRNLYDGERVSFTIHDFGKGPQARDVRRRT